MILNAADTLQRFLGCSLNIGESERFTIFYRDF